MRKNKIYTLFAGALAVIALTGCKQEYEPIENRIYINEAAHKNVKSVAVNVGEKTLTDFTVHSRHYGERRSCYDCRRRIVVERIQREDEP